MRKYAVAAVFLLLCRGLGARTPVAPGDSPAFPVAPDTVSVSVAVRTAADTVSAAVSDAVPVEVSDTVSPAAAVAPDPERRLAEADSLRREYRFREAVKLCDSLLSTFPDTAAVERRDSVPSTFRDTLSALSPADSLIRDRTAELLRLSETGMDFSDNVSLPTVIARQKFSVSDFFLYYPLPDGVWRDAAACTGLRDSLSNAHARECLGAVPDVIFFQEGDSLIFFPSADTLGNLRIFTSRLDSLWSVPVPVFPADTAEGRLCSGAILHGDSSGLSGDIHGGPHSDEIFPFLSADRRSLYFSARRGDSAGGYDIYESLRQEDGSWGGPVNLGFPYSSVDNDYLYMNTDDGRYTVFASDRGCGKDSLYVYILEYEFSPEQQRITDAERLKEIIALAPEDGVDVMETGSVLGSGIPATGGTDRYMAKMEEVRSLRDSLAGEVGRLDAMREEFAMSDDVERRMELTESILRKEAELPALQSLLDGAISELQKIEMEFLSGGVVIDYDKMSAEVSRNIVGDSSNFIFRERSRGVPLRLDFVQAEAAANPDRPASKK